VITLEALMQPFPVGVAAADGIDIRALNHETVSGLLQYRERPAIGDFVACSDGPTTDVAFVDYQNEAFRQFTRKANHGTAIADR
jgi:hypothetical protein